MWQVLVLLCKLSCTSLRRMALPLRWELALLPMVLPRWELGLLPMLEAMHPIREAEHPGKFP